MKKRKFSAEQIAKILKSYENGNHVLGVTNKSGVFRKVINVYLSKAAFVSSEQLYMTMHLFNKIIPVWLK